MPDEKLNGWYDISFFQNYTEYAIPVEIQDGDILVPKEKLKTEFRPFVITSNFTLEEITKIKDKLSTDFQIQILDTSDFNSWIKNNTYLEEVSTNKFLVSNEIIFAGETFPAKYLDLN